MLKRISLFCLITLLTACVPPSYQQYVIENNIDGVKQLKAQGVSVNTLDYWGTPLATAARTNNVEIAQYLIDQGADINRGNPDGYESKTPLHATAAHNSLAVAKLLLAQGANTTIRNREGLTALQVAYAHDSADVADLLNRYAMTQASWDKTRKLDTYQAYASFINAYPDSPYLPQANKRLEKLEESEQKRLQTQQQLASLEASLPPEVRRDKYMVSLAGYLKQQDYKNALTVFPKLESLSVKTDPSLKYFYGEALLKTGEPTKALQKLYEYINEQGTGATHYARSLELINQAESQL